MGKNKLSKFADMERFANVLQFPFSEISKGKLFEYKGKWAELFGNDNPIVLELGCGRGEYALGLAKRCPDKNFIGIDIKGARMWTGAKAALEQGINNVRFLRTEIEYIETFFAEGEVSEIWITFPDPQMKKPRKRLTSTYFLRRYLNILAPAGFIHLKTDSPFLYTYTNLVVRHNNFPLVACIDDVHNQCPNDEILSIQTAYEQQWMQRGLSIKYISFLPQMREEFIEPTEEIPYDEYRSYGRNSRRNNQ